MNSNLTRTVEISLLVKATWLFSHRGKEDTLPLPLNGFASSVLGMKLHLVSSYIQQPVKLMPSLYLNPLESCICLCDAVGHSLMLI